MKFAGLILICASFSLALLLPALGVVKFPTLPTNSPGTPTNLNGQSTGLSPQTNGSLDAPTPGLLAATAASTSDPSNPQSLNDQSLNTQPYNDKLGKIPFTQIQSQRVALGAWVLLVPTLLVGLAMWTFSPPPKGAKS
jgi:hypothetical protein